jgi:hypothetical protein
LCALCFLFDKFVLCALCFQYLWSALSVCSKITRL